MKLSSRVLQNGSLFVGEAPLTDIDLERMPLRVKHMNVVHYAEGFFFHINVRLTLLCVPRKLTQACTHWGV